MYEAKFIVHDEPLMEVKRDLSTDTKVAAGGDILLTTMQTAFRVVADGGYVLFIGSSEKTKHLAEDAAMESCQHFMNYWQAGALENFVDQVREFKTIGIRLTDDDEHLAAPVARRLKQRHRMLHKLFHGIGQELNQPKLVFVCDAAFERAAIDEAGRVGIPVAAAVDDGHARGVTYALPKDGISTSFYARMIARAARDGIASAIGYDRSSSNKDPAINSFAGPQHQAHALLRAWEGLRDNAISQVILDEGAEGPFNRLPPDAFALNENLLEMICAKFDNPVLTSYKRRELKRRAKITSTPRVLEAIGSRARRMAVGVTPTAPLWKGGLFDTDFVAELQKNLPAGQGPEFYERLGVEISEFLHQGGRISGTWGRLLIKEGAVEFDLAARPKPSPDRDWEKPRRVEWN